MKGALVELILLGIWMLCGLAWLGFYAKTPALFVGAAVLLGCYYAFRFCMQTVVNHFSSKTSVSSTGRKVQQVVGFILVGVLSVLVIASIVFKCVRMEMRYSVEFVGFVLLVGLGVYFLLHYLWTNQPTNRPLLFRYVVLSVVHLAMMLISDGQLVRWQYREYPAFVQLYDFLELDPDNQEIQHSLMLEHMKIVLSEEEFNVFEEKNKFQHRSKMAW